MLGFIRADNLFFHDGVESFYLQNMRKEPYIPPDYAGPIISVFHVQVHVGLCVLCKALEITLRYKMIHTYKCEIGLNTTASTAPRCTMHMHSEGRLSWLGRTRCML